MSNDQAVVNLGVLRRSCADCSLRALCLPAGVDLQDLDQLEQFVQKPPPLVRGDKLFHAGETFEFIHVVRSGSLKTVHPSEDGEDQIMGLHLPGELLGLDAISDEFHHCHAIALERTSVCSLPFARLEQAATEFPSLQRQLHRIISREIQHDQEHLAALGRRTARERLAAFLCSLSRRLGTAGYSETDLGLPMSREDIANYLGLALETVSRLFKQLADEGQLEVERRKIRILDRDALARIAGTCAPDNSDPGSERGRRTGSSRA